ncbi:hypothetical protein D3C75_1012870 [compost metagenome]
MPLGQLNNGMGQRRAIRPHRALLRRFILVECLPVRGCKIASLFAPCVDATKLVMHSGPFTVIAIGLRRSNSHSLRNLLGESVNPVFGLDYGFSGRTRNG